MEMDSFNLVPEPKFLLVSARKRNAPVTAVFFTRSDWLKKTIENTRMPVVEHFCSFFTNQNVLKTVATKGSCFSMLTNRNVGSRDVIGIRVNANHVHPHA